MNTRRFAPLAAAAAALALAAAAHAQPPAAPVLKMNQVTEQALLDALAIDEPAAADDGVRTRSIRPSMRAAATAAPRPSAGRSNLLITFRTNSAELTPESKEALAKVARALQSDRLASLAFHIEGHADRRGGEELNQRLSESRAKAVVDHLITEHGILAERLEPIGKGASEPLNLDRTDAAENRRVTIVTKRP